MAAHSGTARRLAQMLTVQKDCQIRGRHRIVDINVYNRPRGAEMNVRVLAVMLMVAGGTASAQPAPAEWASWLGAETGSFSGAVLVGRDDAIEIQQAFGLADPARRRPNRPETRFNLGSINKT